MKYSELLVKLFDELKGEMRFVKYYKYIFTFAAENDEYRLELSYGGNPDDIYKFNLDASMTLANWKIEDFDLYSISKAGCPDEEIEYGELQERGC